MGPDEQIPPKSLQEWSSAVLPIAYEISDPQVLPIVPATTTAQNSQGPPVSGSTLLGSEMRKPAKGRISSEGSGIIADSIVIATSTPR